MATIKEITSYSEWDAHLASLPPTTLLIVSFHAPWAAPCAQMATVLSTLASEYPADGSTSWVSLNAEELSDISEKYDVTAVPFLVLSKNAKVLETVSGSSAVKVRNAIEAHAGKPGATTAATNGASAGGAPAVDEPTETDPAKAKEELNKRLEELVKAAPVMLFMKGTPSGPQCGFSRQMVALLRENSVKYGFFNILADDEVRQGLKEFADWPTYPQLWIEGELVGGLDIVSLRSVCSHPTVRWGSWLTIPPRSRRKSRTTRTISSLTASKATASERRMANRIYATLKMHDMGHPHTPAEVGGPSSLSAIPGYMI